MKVGLITRFESINWHSFPDRIREEFEKRGHSYTVINPADIAIIYDGDSFPLRYEHDDLNSIDIFDHAFRSDDNHGWEIAACLHNWHYNVLRPERDPRGDKVTMARLFARAGIRMPRSAVLDHEVNMAKVVEELGGYPVVGKARNGSQGRNVAMINSDAELQAFITEAQKVAPNFLLQEVIRPLGSDIRVFVVGDRAVAAMKRFAPEGDFRSNYSLSQHAEPFEITAEIETLAVQVAKLYQTNFCGVDIMISNGELIVIEINKAPGLKGIESVTNINVAAKVVAFYEQQFTASQAA